MPRAGDPVEEVSKLRSAVGGNIARFINHKCAPNCYTRVIGDTIWIIAARNIRKFLSESAKTLHNVIPIASKANRSF